MMQKILWLLLLFFCLHNQVSANLADHLVISEVVYGNSNASDELVEIYNPTNQAINLKNLDLKLHIRNSTGSTDTNKTITWINETIPAYGFFLFTAQDSNTYKNQADATFSAGMVSHGAVYISLASTKMLQVIDFIAWGNHAMPVGFENQKTVDFASGQNIERKSDANGIIANLGNAWDTDTNDFVITSINPQNSNSASENPVPIVLDTTPPAEISNLQTDIKATEIYFCWNNPIDTDFKQVELKLDNNNYLAINNTNCYLQTGLLPATSYNFTFITVDNTDNKSAGANFTYQTAIASIPPAPISNLQVNNLTFDTVSFAWQNPVDINSVLVKINDQAEQDLGLVNNYTWSNLNENTSYNFVFYTKNQDQLVSTGTNQTITTLIKPDTTPPLEISNLQINANIKHIVLNWQNPSDLDLADLLISYTGVDNNWSDVQSIGLVTSYALENLVHNTNYQIKIQTKDTVGNISTGIIQSVTTLNCPTSAVIINEIAWPGMTVIANQEQAESYGHSYQWLELFNNQDTAIDLYDWKITSDQGLEILLDGLTIAPKSFLILQNNELDIFIDELVADLYYEDPVDADLKTILIDQNTTNLQLVNQCEVVIDNIPQIYTGDYTGYRSMARVNPTLPANNSKSWFNEKINGSPAETNIFYPINLSIAYIDPSPFNPVPNQPFTINAVIANLKDAPALAKTWDLQIWQDDNLLKQVPGVDLLEYGDNTVLSVNMPAMPEGDYELLGQIICGQSCGKYSWLDQSLQVKLSPIISEIMAKPKTNEYQWLELYNPLDTVANTTGSIICHDDVYDDCMTLNIDLPPKSYTVLNEQEMANFTNDQWLKLNTTEDKIIWTIKQKKKTITYDIFYYNNATIGQSLAQRYSKIQNSKHITKGLANDYNQNPVAIIAVQAGGDISGTAPFSFNPTAEKSYDPDADPVTFLWNFGNNIFSDKENPTNIKYDTIGSYNVKLTVYDDFGGVDKEEITITVRSRSHNNDYTTTETNATTNTPMAVSVTTPIVPVISPVENILISKISINDSESDWIEIACPSCETEMSLAKFTLLDDKVFFTFGANDKISKSQSIVIKLAENNLGKQGQIWTITKDQGLTKTDEQLILFDHNQQIADAVCWNNFDDKYASGEELAENNLKQRLAWQGDCVNSKLLSVKDKILLRDLNMVDSNTKEDWFYLDNILPFAPVIKPVSINDVEIFFQAIDFKNAEADNITLFCQQCTKDLAGMVLSIGESNVFTFPENTIIANNTSFKIIFGEGENTSSIEQIFYVPKKSLTGTDDAISLKDSNNAVEDFVCWSNRKGTEKRDTDLDGIMFSLLQKRQEQTVWQGECLDSSSSKNYDQFVRTDFTSHLNSLNTFSLQSKPTNEVIVPQFLDGLVISEILINPVGDDSKFEWIELQNISDQTINTNAWSLEIKTRHWELPAFVLAPQEFWLIKKPDFSLSFPNKEEVIILKNPADEIKEQVVYTTTYEESTFAKNEQAEWQWTSLKTPGFANQFITVGPKARDNDMDGLKDEVELILGTDPQNRDTDADKLPDGFEVENKLNPLQINDNFDLSKFQQFLTEKTVVKVKLPAKNKGILKIYGTTEPLAKVKIYVHSNLQIYVSQADKKGVWEQELSKLEAGEHKVQTQIINVNGIKSNLSSPVKLVLNDNYQINLAELKAKNAKSKTTKKIRVAKNKSLTPIPDFLLAQNYPNTVSKISSSSSSPSKNHHRLLISKINNSNLILFWSLFFGSLAFIYLIVAKNKLKV